ncbi:GAF and ANTAR domain-containing protein [Actinoplanes friuliensis]|uniref:ANTAR domain-containing protein n=1 Tax=Actinoplanes friuliensis DSM 7358 TaxID=1246995 RepID=U5VW52_9ACTN|nr:GAF and ANTAR domain-containing protein [Actinoplanes friuliensis]AGZ41213.1 ANTAR domain-containing protein [Actinoplanes friuliensis DSM 7358]
MTDQQPLDPTHAFAELGRIKLHETDLDGVLLQVATLAKRTIPGIEDASVSLIRAKNARTAAFTGELARQMDERQYEEGGGPCMEAAATLAVVSVPDLGDEQRWPHYTPAALKAGVHSSLSVGLPMHEDVTGALNMYSRKPDAFDDEAVVLARTFSGYAAVAVSNAHTYDATTTLAQHMQAAMEHRAVIEQAKGIIMASRHCTADEAFKILSKLSQDTNRKLRDVAAALVEQAPASPKR